MAVTSIHAIKTTLKKALDYIMNPEKTDGSLLISGFKVTPETAYIEYRMTEELAKSVKGNYNKKNPNLAYHVIQSFPVTDNITPEEAHEIGKKLADEFLKGKHEYVLSTHIDKGHIHNHIIFNAVSFGDYKKFNSQPYITASDLRSVSDKLCIENGLDVIKEPKGKGKSYKEWSEDRKGTSWKTLLKNNIDKAILQANTYNEFLQIMRQFGYVIKQGKHIAFKAPNQNRFTRSKTIGDNYTEEIIKARIENKQPDIISNEKKNKEITINKKLVMGETENAFLTRIPYTKKYAWISKDHAQWDNEKKITISAKLETDQVYNLVTQEGELLEIVSGEEIQEYYDNAAKRREEKALMNKEGKYFVSITDANKVPYPLDKKLFYKLRKEKLVDVKEFANTLVMLRREYIFKYNDFNARIEGLKVQSKDLKNDMKQLENKHEAYKEVAKYLVSYNKFLPFKKQYEKQSIFKKKDFQKKYESELLAFEHSKNKLEEMNVNPEIDLKRVVEALKSQEGNVKNIQTEFKTIDQKIDRLLEAQDIVNKLLYPEEAKGEAAKKEREER